MALFGDSKQQIIKEYESKLEEKSREISELKKEISDMHNLVLQMKKSKEDSSILCPYCGEKASTKEAYCEKCGMRIDNHAPSENKISLNTTNTATVPQSESEKDIRSFVLGAGMYRGGINIPTGIYDLYIESGLGSVYAKIPDNISVFLNSNTEENRRYNGVVVTEKTILSINNSAKIRFDCSSKISLGMDIDRSAKEKEDLLTEIEKIKQVQENLADNILTSGTYKAGEDFPPGKYDFYAISGEGIFECSKGDIYSRMSGSSESEIMQFRNISVANGTRIKISDNLKVAIFHSREIKPESSKEGSNNILTHGKYKVGTDLPDGSFSYIVLKGSGYIDDNDEICENLETGSKGRFLLKKGKTLDIDGNLEMALYYPSPITIVPSSDTSNVLCAGTYESGIDIPYGFYNLIMESGDGDCILYDKDKNTIFEKYFDSDDDDEYRNLLFGVGTVFEVSSGLQIRLEYSKPYIDKDLSKKILKEFDDVKSELKVLNNETIEKYYIFSDFESLTSQDCQNQLSILKVKEKELRNVDGDILVLEKGEKKKTAERCIRQILRNFNSECDNLIMNIKVKNIDLIRSRIQKSYETLNQLYSVDGISLTDKILALKLEQATLLYTYELKYQQEKDIQQAVKEQMIEEAKAEREIQEQKKKIEKDLQQHLGEVNRLMKYMQKTQIDAEKQLYLDKIKELEEKIKLLESDKETVLEREANAKAGFVYIISNIGSFGENIYKIGMARRLEPMDRVKELSSASVPFEFDVHAMIFSSDAPDLENMLHHHFADRAVNKVNPRKEFYHVDIDEIEQVVKENYNDTVQFTKIPVAYEYRQSLEL